MAMAAPPSPLLFPFPASFLSLWLRCLRHGLRGGVTCAAVAARADGDGRGFFTSLLLFAASCSTLWLRCLPHGLRGGVTCAAFAVWADGDGRPSFTSPLPD